jgi:acyl transferase domain-containing protein/NAD(P)H-dependent flavin oxidoreductase YrpB (nitropropane dioxygenase family)/NAD(P)-dependent dehydrogenase (short-subunit alcohol dehydrogenase family)
VLDLEFVGTDPEAPKRLQDKVHWLCDHIRSAETLGIRIPTARLAEHPTQYAACLSALDTHRSLVILTELPTPEISKLARGYGDRRLMVEVRSFDSYLRLMQLIEKGVEVDGVIACGHEMGGLIGDDTTFILLQKLLRLSQTQHQGFPVYARSGIGFHTATGCRVAGAAGVVLDDQLLLMPESPLPDEWKQHLAGLTGQETVVLGQETGYPCRVLDRPVFAGLTMLKERGHTIGRRMVQDPTAPASWAYDVETNVAWRAPSEAVWPIGQGIALAESFRQRYKTTGDAVQAILRESARGVELTRTYQPLAPGAPLAHAHRTEYPVVQGPMTRVSDKAGFALAVAEAGALPFVALALMKGTQARLVLEETHKRLGERPWGVGILGFLPPEVRQEQLHEVLRVRPPFALIAGGRGELALTLENEGIATYLHTPLPSLLRSFLKQGVRRFIFEGRECGGHVGPLCSFPLWETMIQTLLESVPPDEAESVHVLFAGGIHDSLSASIVAAIGAPLAERGIRCGVLMGTAYLFTEEAVQSGAILKRYQQEAISCQNTVLLTSGAGHANRIASTAFADEFERRRQMMLQEERPAGEVRNELENLMVGRLRLASKGLIRDEDGNLVQAEDARQASDGVYMLGQAATLRSSVCRISDLHRDVCTGATQRVEAISEKLAPRTKPRGEPEGIAIVGMGMLLPGARTPDHFWRNVLHRVEAIQEVPRSRWDIERMFDVDKTARDKTYARWGGFIEDIPFDPVRYRIPPTAMRSISTTQLLALEVTRWALEDAGYAERAFDRANTAVIIGTTGGGSFLNESLFMRTLLPHFVENVPEQIISQIPEWTGETFPGVLANVTAGRIANQFDLGGPNYSVDAACAASLVAIDMAVRELESGRSNMVIAGGVDTSQTPFSYIAFSKTQALSPSGRARIFDKSADGIVISEGVGIVVLKRLEEARRDGDRIYAVIRGTGGSSDGKGLGLTAPKVDGQIIAMERALRNAGIQANSLGLYEAHGTGTPLGDRTELDTLVRVLNSAGAAPRSCAVGSAKGLVGHTKTAAGVVGVIKAALALHHRVLPPHTKITEPLNSLVDATSPIYTLEQPRPWLAKAGQPRRAGVSAFGFGGTNSHVLLESTEDAASPLGADEWPCELLLFCAPNEVTLLKRIEALQQALTHGAIPRLCDLAFTLARQAEQASTGPRLAIVAHDLEELITLLSLAGKMVRGEISSTSAPANSSVIFAGADEAGCGKPGHPPRDQPGSPTAGCVAFLFPGQGAQYLNMAGEQALYLAELREALEFTDEELRSFYEQALSEYIFPPAAFDHEQQEQQKQELADTHRAQPAIGTISLGFLELLERLGLRPDMVAGHSYGELTGLHAAGVLSRRDFIQLSQVRGQIMAQCCQPDSKGGMVSVQATREQVATLLAKFLPGSDTLAENVVIANHNGPRQTVISGAVSALEPVVAALTHSGLPTLKLRVAGAFHSPLMAPALKPWNTALESIELRAPRLPVYGNLDGMPYPAASNAIRNRLSEHLLQSVEFVAQITRMHTDGARLFIEVGPGNILSHLVTSILEGKPHLCVALDPQKGRMCGLLSSLGMLAVRGALPYPIRLFDGRCVHTLNLDNLVAETKPEPLTSTTWWVNGTLARPLEDTTADGIPHSEAPARLTPQLAPEPLSAPSPAGAALNGSSTSHETAPPMPLSRGDNQAEILAAYTAYQETMRRFLDLEEQALAGFFALAQSNGVLNAPLNGGTDKRIEPPPTVVSPVATASEWNKTPTAFAQAEHNSGLAPLMPPPEVAAPFYDAEELQRLILRILSEQTGYPPEMLGLDLDLAGELGIDSLRKVQCLTDIAEALPESLQGTVSSAMDDLLSAPTVRSLLDLLTPQLASSPSPAQVEGQPKEPVSHAFAIARPSRVENGYGGTATSGTLVKAKSPTIAPKEMLAERNITCPRYMPKGITMPLGDAPPVALDGAVVLIEDDLGVAQLLAEKLRQRNFLVVSISRNIAAERHALQHLRDLPESIGAILHLAALSRAPLPERFEDWHRLAQTEAKSFFQVLNLTAPQILHPQTSSPRIMAATLMGGWFGRKGCIGPGSPLGGAGVGLLKSLALEWPQASVRAIDFDGAQSQEQIAEAIISELLHEDVHSEIGYPDGVRTVFTNLPAPHAARDTHMHTGKGSAPDIQPTQDWVILVTGGARGITAEALRTLVCPGMTVIVVGRSAVLSEPEELARMGDAAALRNHFITKASQGCDASPNGDNATPAQLEARVQEVLHQRERRSTLAQLSQSGATVIYKSCDGRDPHAVNTLMDWLYATYGRLDAFLHGAGIIEDKLLADKDWDSFDRVFDTKVDSAYLLSQHIRPEGFKLAVFFGSVSGRVGNPGQTDYAAANEVLNRMAWYLNQRWPKARVVSINWGPWASSGMATSAVRTRLEDRGILPIQSASGCAFLAEEIALGQHDEVEILAGEGPWDCN